MHTCEQTSRAEISSCSKLEWSTQSRKAGRVTPRRGITMQQNHQDASYADSPAVSLLPTCPLKLKTTQPTLHDKGVGLHQGNPHWEPGENSLDPSYTSTGLPPMEAVTQGSGFFHGDPHWEPGGNEVHAHRFENHTKTTLGIKPTIQTDRPETTSYFLSTKDLLHEPTGAISLSTMTNDFDQVHTRAGLIQDNDSKLTAISSDSCTKAPSTTDQGKSLWISNDLKHEVQIDSNEDQTGKTCFVSGLNTHVPFSSDDISAELSSPFPGSDDLSILRPAVKPFLSCAGKDSFSLDVPSFQTSDDIQLRIKIEGGTLCSDEDWKDKTCFVSGLNTYVPMCIAKEYVADLSTHVITSSPRFELGIRRSVVYTSSLQPYIKPFVCCMYMSPE